MNIESLNLVVGVLFGIVAVIVAFPEGRVWLKGKLKNISELTIDIFSLKRFLALLNFLLRKLILVMAYLGLAFMFVVFMVVVFPPIRNFFIFTDTNIFPSSDLSWVLVITLFIIGLLILWLIRLSTKVSFLSGLKIIADGIESQNKEVIEKLIINWLEISKELTEKRRAPSVIKECQPAIYDNGILHIKCPTQAIFNELKGIPTRKMKYSLNEHSTMEITEVRFFIDYE